MMDAWRYCAVGRKILAYPLKTHILAFFQIIHHVMNENYYVITLKLPIRNTMKLVKNSSILALLCMFNVLAASAKTAEFFENVFAAPASEKLVAQGQKAAELIGYEKAVEMASPKKAGIEINPLNKFIYGQINPQTQNALIVANPEWLSLMPEEQQFFLIARALMRLKEGTPFL